jgi:hypothetical protein
MTLRFGSPWVIALFLFVLGAEGLAGAATAIPWTVTNAFLAGTLWGLYLALIAVVLRRQLKGDWRQARWA